MPRPRRGSVFVIFGFVSANVVDGVSKQRFDLVLFVLGFTATSLVTMAIVAVSVVAVATATVLILLWHRKPKQRREAKTGGRRQQRQQQQMKKSDSSFVLGGFNRSPSLHRSASPAARPCQSPAPGKGQEGGSSSALVRSQSGPRQAEGDWRPSSSSHPALYRRQSDSGGGGGGDRWRSVVLQLDLLRPVSGTDSSIPQCKSLNDFRRTVRQVAATTTTTVAPPTESPNHRSLERLLSDHRRGGQRHPIPRQSKRQAVNSDHGHHHHHQSDDSTRSANRSASSLV